MMENLEDIAEYYAQNPNEWSYYPIDRKDFIEYLKCPNEAIKFIRGYFALGGKEVAIPLFTEKDRERLQNRPCHIISTFLLGLKIANCFGVNVEYRNKNMLSFQYYWFLACLFHDLGYIYEGGSTCENIFKVSNGGLKALIEVMDCQYYCSSMFKTYSEKLVDIYLKNRAQCVKQKCGTIDHGIAGGLLLYNGLRKQFELARGDNKNKTDFKVRNLNYSISHFEDYGKIADAIIAHNIWMDTLRNYLQNYPEMVEESIPKMVTFDNEICYMLCIADTIEPLKRGKHLTDIMYDFSTQGQFIIRTDRTVYNDVYRNILDLSTWVDVEVNVSCGDIVEITISKKVDHSNINDTSFSWNVLQNS